MSAEERLAGWHPARFIELLATRSAEFAWQAGVGGRETAGGLISYLAAHPEHIEPFINGGIFELPMEWITEGVLTWHGLDGRVYAPADRVAALRAANLPEVPA
jgi:hypothetical protein